MTTRVCRPPDRRRAPYHSLPSLQGSTSGHAMAIFSFSVPLFFFFFFSWALETFIEVYQQIVRSTSPGGNHGVRKILSLVRTDLSTFCVRVPSARVRLSWLCFSLLCPGLPWRWPAMNIFGIACFCGSCRDAPFFHLAFVVDNQGIYCPTWGCSYFPRDC